MSAAFDALLTALRGALGRAPGAAPPPVPRADLAPHVASELVATFIANAERAGSEVRRCRDVAAELAALVPAGARLHRDGTGPAPDPFALDYAFARADVAIAASGSVVLSGEPLPPMSAPTLIVEVAAADLVATLRDALQQLAARAAPPTRLIVSGPSKTADIEGILVAGVHGPKRLVLLLTSP